MQSERAKLLKHAQAAVSPVRQQGDCPLLRQALSIRVLLSTLAE
jgi:hypothetical protein